MKTPFFSINKSEKSSGILIYHGVGSIVVPYMNLVYITWHEQIVMQFTGARITFTPPTTFNIQNFLEALRDQWLYELREENELEIEVCLVRD